MKVILKSDVPHLGRKHEAKNVRQGFFVNYLYPRGLAIAVTPGLLKESMKIIERRRKGHEEKLQKANEVLSLLKDQILAFSRKVGKGKRLFGSITEKDIIEALKGKNINISKEQISMKSHIKSLGEHLVRIHLYEGVETDVKVLVDEEK